MPNLTLSVSDRLKQEIDSLPEINWSESVRKFLEEKVEEYKRYSNEQNIGAPFTDRLMGYDHAKKKLDELFWSRKKI